MTKDEMAALFEKFMDDEYIKFGRVENPTSKRPDLHAFMLLDRLVPGKLDIISASEHDQFWIDVDADELAKVATEADVVELVRCGVRYDEDNESLCMFA